MTYDERTSFSSIATGKSRTLPAARTKTKAARCRQEPTEPTEPRAQGKSFQMPDKSEPTNSSRSSSPSSSTSLSEPLSISDGKGKSISARTPMRTARMTEPLKELPAKSPRRLSEEPMIVYVIYVAYSLCIGKEFERKVNFCF